MEGDMKQQELLSRLVTWFEDAGETQYDSFQLASRCRDYYDGKQLTEAEREELRRRKQPPVVNNRIRRKVDWLRGLEMQSRTDPKAFPRTPKHEQGAQAATDAIRYVCDNTDFDRKRSWAWENMLIEGACGLEILHEFKPPMAEPEIVINHYPYDRLFADPYSRRPDFSDARYKGAVVWMDADALKEQHKGKDAEIDGSVAYTGPITQQFEDMPAWKQWGDRTRRRVRVVVIHWAEGGKWMWAKFVRMGILEQGESPYVDETGYSVCPLVMQSAYIDRDGNRYGVVKDMLDLQDEINKRRSKLLHALNTRQTMGIRGAVDPRVLKVETGKPDGHIDVDPAVAEQFATGNVKPFEFINQTDQIMGQFQLLAESKGEIDLLGANSGLSGKDESGQSGRAIMARQQGGLIEIAPLTDNLSDFTRNCYRHIWMRIRQFWRGEKWLRVTDDERNVRFVGLNRPVTLRDRLAELPPEQVQQIALQMQLVPGDPRFDMPVEIENPVEEIDVDILIEEVPDTVTLEAETFQQIVNIATSLPGSVPPEIMIEMAPGLKRDVKDRLLQNIQQSAAQQGTQSEAVMMAQGQAMQLDNLAKEAKAQRDMAAAAKTNVEAQRLALGY